MMEAELVVYRVLEKKPKTRQEVQLIKLEVAKEEKFDMVPPNNQLLAQIDAKEQPELAKLLRVLRCKINLIPFNPFPASGFEKPELTQVNAFRAVLVDAGYATTLRTTRGIDIAAACGQLTGEVTDRTKRQKRYQQRLKIVNESL